MQCAILIDALYGLFKMIVSVIRTTPIHQRAQRLKRKIIYYQIPSLYLILNNDLNYNLNYNLNYI